MTVRLNQRGKQIMMTPNIYMLKSSETASSYNPLKSIAMSQASHLVAAGPSSAGAAGDVLSSSP